MTRRHDHDEHPVGGEAVDLEHEAGESTDTTSTDETGEVDPYSTTTADTAGAEARPFGADETLPGFETPADEVDQNGPDTGDAGAEDDRPTVDETGVAMDDPQRG
jgi:hypothetical protein